MRQLLLVVIITCLFCAHGFCQARPRYALVIGNASYPSPGYLRNPLNDADTMERRLTECGFQVTKLKNVRQAQFKTAIDEFFQKLNSQKCEAFFYYSGHGIQLDGENYLIPVDAELHSASDVSSYCFPLDKVLGKLEDSKSSTNIIVLDACRNNPFSRGWRGEGEKGLQVVNHAPKESFIIYATSPNSVANDGKGSNSPLVAAFSNNMKRPGVSINELLIKIINEVNQQYPLQRPWGSVSIRKEFYFVPPKDSVQQLTATRAIEAPRKELADIVFVSDADCILTIRDDNNPMTMKAGAPVQLSRYPDKFTLRAISLSDSTVSWDSICDYTTDEINVTYIGLLNKLREKKQRMESDANFIRQRAAIEAIRLNMLRISGGEFVMGNASGNNDESPEHRVSLRSFYLGRFEVTQEQWDALMNANPSGFSGCANCPVENVSWDDAKKFIDKLNFLSGERYRLPTESEWEYAARGGNMRSPANAFSGGSKIERYGWAFRNSGKKTHEGGELAANERGAYDMTGNVAEWCEDWYDASAYKKAASSDPQGPSSGREKVIRGGSWNDDENNCRNSLRQKGATDSKSKMIGFRVAKSE